MVSVPLVALVTGGASGIGEAISLQLAKDGMLVVIADINEAGGASTVSQIASNGGKAAFVKLDVASEAEWADAVKFCVTTFGSLSVLVNNAGIADSGKPIEASNLAEYDRVIRITQTSVFLGCKAAAEELFKGGNKSSVVNISSLFGIVGGDGTNPAYAAAKGAVRNLSKNVALAWAPKGVRCNSVHPGFILTPLFKAHFTPDVIKQMEATVPIGRLGSPQDIASLVSFLVSENAGFITGSEFVCDGGYLAK